MQKPKKEKVEMQQEVLTLLKVMEPKSAPTSIK